MSSSAGSCSRTRRSPRSRRRRASPPARTAAGTRTDVAGRAPVGVVGREHELGRLEQLYDAAAGGERRLVFVSGEPGAGKTTLVYAFLEGLDASVHVGRGQCVESRGAGEAYMPVLEALGRLCRADDGGRLVQLLRERAPTWLVQLPWLVAEEERASLETRVVGVTRDRMLREIVEVLEAFSADEPAVLVLEDLHWADYSTLDLLDVIARRFEPARLLVLGTFRPAEARSAGHPLRGLVQSLRVRNLCSEVALGSLSESATHAFLALHLDGTDPGGEVAALLHSRTRGNPLYMEKLVEAWIDEGALTRESGAWVVARDLDELARSVPETLRSLIEQRCAALEPDTHRLLEAVSVAGAEFATATAAAAAEMDEDEAERRLRDVALDAHVHPRDRRRRVARRDDLDPIRVHARPRLRDAPGAASGGSAGARAPTYRRPARGRPRRSRRRDRDRARMALPRGPRAGARCPPPARRGRASAGAERAAGGDRAPHHGA